MQEPFLGFKCFRVKTCPNHRPYYLARWQWVRTASWAVRVHKWTSALKKTKKKLSQIQTFSSEKLSKLIGPPKTSKKGIPSQNSSHYQQLHCFSPSKFSKRINLWTSYQRVTLTLRNIFSSMRLINIEIFLLKIHSQPTPFPSSHSLSSSPSCSPSTQINRLADLPPNVSRKTTRSEEVCNPISWINTNMAYSCVRTRTPILTFLIIQ